MIPLFRKSCCTLACLLFIFTAGKLNADNNDIGSLRVQLKGGKSTIYQLLRDVSEQSGYLFVYDSQLVNNNQVVKVPKGKYSITDAVFTITGNRKLKLKVVEKHILLYLPTESNTSAENSKQDSFSNPFYTISGKLYDHAYNVPIPYASVSINNTSIGTVTNKDGAFTISIPSTLPLATIKFSHLGYENQEAKVSPFSKQNLTYMLESKAIPIQEAAIRHIDPIRLLKKMMEKRAENYSHHPVKLTTFYREGISYKKNNIDVSEAVLEVYKHDYQNTVSTDQVKLVKMRRIMSGENSYEFLAKIRAGIEACLSMDIIKHIPDFLEVDWGKNASPFKYTHTGISEIDGKRVNAISFEQKKHVITPMYKGTLYVDAETYALVEAHFEVNSAYTNDATSMYVERRSKDFKLNLQSASYNVSYKRLSDSIYYINHIRGDLQFKGRKKGKLFSSPLHVWFEMVTCDINTQDVKTFPRKERLSTNKIFSETKHLYDSSFWENFNIITPENDLKEFIMSNINEISKPAKDVE